MKVSDCMVFAIGTGIAIHVNAQRGMPVIGGEALLPLVLLGFKCFCWGIGKEVWRHVAFKREHVDQHG